MRYVVHPTLVIFSPPNRERATHTGVIICLSGGFLLLSINSKGYDVARTRC